MLASKPSPECGERGTLNLTGSRHSQLQGREPRVCSPASCNTAVDSSITVI